MRLSKTQHQAIKKYFLEVFHDGHIYLFGSRVNDEKKGGDIDLYIDSPDKKNLVHKKIDFLVKLKKEIGNQKIDVVFNKGLNRVIDKVAIKEGILL
ncbi:MAG: nucleotidyltransferase domain-containing protein [Bacteroidales bacterium]|nr:nucleotidyltransferase domain-containing protein [Bacteroidales bacterium]